MNKADFFKAACKAHCFRRKQWVISAFSLVAEGPEDWKRDPYPYRIVSTPMGYFCVDPDDHTQLLPIEAEPDLKLMRVPLFTATEQFVMIPGDLPNYGTMPGEDKPVKTTYGNFLWNWMVLCWALGNKVAYVNDRIAPGDLEELILKRLQDDPQAGDPVPKAIDRVAPIWTSEYLQVVEAAFYSTGFTQLFVPADTRKSMTAPPGLAEYKAKLIEENKDRLHDPAVIAEMDAKLIKFDSEYLKGDESEGFLISGKSRTTVRRKLFLSLGGEPGLDEESGNVEFIPNSLTEGWDISKFPVMNNTQRAGSFNRSAQTMLGGESVKWLLRASSNMQVTMDDCGTQLGVPTEFTEKSIQKYLGFHVVAAGGPKEITEADAGTYVGKKFMLRSPLFCKLEKTDYCKICVGPRLALNPTALSSAVTEVGSTIMLIFMKAAHARNLAVAHMDYLSEIQ
jgi:hypothetical protein